MSIKRIIIFAFVLLLLLAACGEAEQEVPSPPPSPTATPRPTPRPTPTPSPTPTPEPEPEFVNPLTGLELEDDIYLTSTCAAFMLNNIKAATPQHGIGEADMIYEIAAEGGITRLLMLKTEWHKLGIVGAIRSTRNYYAEIAYGHSAFLVHAGASEMAYAYMRRSDVNLNRIDGTNGPNTGLFYRDKERMKTRSSEHCLMIKGETLHNFLADTSLDKNRVQEQALTFEDGYAPTDGENATTVKVKLSSVKTTTFQYAEDGRYYVEQFGGPMVDGNTGEQLAVDNVLVLYTDIHLIKGDAYDRLEVDFSKGGDGVYFTGGVVVPIKWTKPSDDLPFSYTTADGDALTLRAGISYICVTNAGSVTAGAGTQQ